LSVSKKIDEEKIQFKLTTTKNKESSEILNKMDIGDFIIFQELLRYSIPYIMGWHILNSPRIAEEELNASTQDNPY